MINRNTYLHNYILQFGEAGGFKIKLRLIVEKKGIHSFSHRGS